MTTHATLLNPNQPNQCFTASPVRARERQIRATKKGILGGLSRGPTRIVLPLIRTTDTLQVQILLPGIFATILDHNTAVGAAMCPETRRNVLLQGLNYARPAPNLVTRSYRRTSF